MAGEIIGLTINSAQRFPRDPESESEIDISNLPEHLVSLVGNYTVPMSDMAFGVTYQDEQLVLVMPGDRKLPLERSTDGNGWTGAGQKGRLKVAFDKDSNGKVVRMLFSELTTCPREIN